MTSAQASDDVGSTIEPTSPMPIFKRLYLVIYKTLALTFPVLLKECKELLSCKIPGWSRHVSYQNRRGLNRPILRPLWLMTSAAADVISVPSVINGTGEFYKVKRNCHNGNSRFSPPWLTTPCTGINLYTLPVNERRRYDVTSSHWLGSFTKNITTLLLWFQLNP